MKFAFKLIIVIVIVHFFNHVHGQNIIKFSYCSRDLCGSKKHIACRNDGSFAARCPDNARFVNLKTVRHFILRRHNYYRNMIASGRIQKYNQARRMATMKWHPKLAYLASLNVRQCRMKHDACRNLPRFKFSGQNLASSTWTGTRNIRELVATFIGNFFKEYRNADMSIINSFRFSNRKYAHFTTMVNEKNTYVGCAAVLLPRVGSTSSKYKHRIYFACNYARNNILGKPVYRNGTRASGCKTGTNSRFPSLCSALERYNTNIP